MKRSILSFVFLLGIVFSYSQTIAKQSFESSGDTWTPITFSTPPCTIGNDRWDFSTTLSTITPNDGNQFWGIQDLRGNCGGAGFESITLPNVTVSSFNNVVFSFDFNVIRYRNNDDIKYELFYDNTSQGEVLLVNGVNNGGNGLNSNGWLTETVNVPSLITTISVVISVQQNDGTIEFAGIDNIRLESITPPANNDCANAPTLTVGTNNTQNIVTGTNLGATDSGEVPTPNCGGYFGNDVWYNVQVPATGNVTIETLNAGSNIDTAIEVYIGKCGNLVQIACDDDSSSGLFSILSLTGLPNTTLHIRVWAFGNFTSGDFDIVAYDDSPPTPPNNNCIDAISLIVGTNNTQNVVTGTNVNATDSGELPIPSCANYNGNDIWYTTQVPASGLLTIETLNAGSSIDTGIAVYTGSCGNLTQVDCDDDTGSNLFSLINITGLANTTIYIRVWAYNNATLGDFNVVAYADLCPFTTRWNNSGWNNGTPNSFTTAIINSDYDTTTDGSFESCDCQVNSGRIINIRANDFITVHNDLTVIGTVEVRHQGSLVMTNNNGQVSVSGIVNVHKTSTILNNFRDFTYWSSPVTTTIDQAFVAVDPNRIFEWDIPSNTSIGDWSIATGSMTPARGYISEAPNTTPIGGTHSVIFTGTPNNGIINTPVGFNNDNFTYSDFNLIGNPYPSAINIDNFIQSSSNTIMDGTIWLWTHNTGIDTSGQFLGFDYATYNLTGGTVTALPGALGGSPPISDIASGQGFFVRTTNSGTLSFQNEMRLNNQNMQFFRAPDTKDLPTQEKDRIWLNIESDTGGAFSQILIGFFDNATDDYDRGYDGTRLGASWISFYSKIDTLGYAVQGLSSFNLDKKVPIGFDTYIADPLTYKISIYDIEGVLNNNDIYLIDHELDIIHNLKLADYQFDVDGEGYFPDRFTLQFTNSVLSVDSLESDHNFIVINQENSLLLRASSTIVELKIYDITGRILIDKKPNDNEFSINTQPIRKGTVLIVHVILENNQSIAKKVILH